MLSPLNDIASLGMQLPPLSLPHSLSPLKHSTNRRNISRPLLPGSVRSNQTYAPLSRSIDRSPGRRARCDEMVSAADAVIPACAAVGIAFAVWHWLLVSRVKVSLTPPPRRLPERRRRAGRVPAGGRGRRRRRRVRGRRGGRRRRRRGRDGEVRGDPKRHSGW